MKINQLLLIATILFGTLLAVPALPRAHALTGTVCLALAGSTTCPTSAQLFSGGVGSTVSVAVVIQGSDNLNGFDVSIQSDPTLFKPTGASVGTVLGSSPTIVLECVNGVLITGNGCTSTDVPGVLHLAAAKTGASVPGSGLLFTATYTVLGQTTGTPVSLFAVTIPNSNIVNSESLQNGTFANLIDFAITANTPVSVVPGSTATSTIRLTSEGGYADIVNMAITAMNLPASLSSSSVDLSVSPTGTDQLTVGPAAAGVYHVTVTATGSGTFFPTNRPTHTVTVEVDVAPTDFALRATPPILNIPHGSSDTTTINVDAITGFTGTVALSATGSATGITGSLSPASVTGAGTSTLTVNVATPLSPGSYSITVTGTSGSSTHTVTVAVNVGVPDFAASALPNSITVPRQAAATAIVQLTSINNFQGTITLTGVTTFVSQDTPGSPVPAFKFTPSSFLLGPGAIFKAEFEADTTPTSGTGNYTVTVTASGTDTVTGLAVSHMITIDYNVQDFSLGPVFCPGSTIIFTTPNGNNPTVGVGSQCNTLTITNQTSAQGGVPGTLWLQVNSLGSESSNGAQGVGSVAGFNPEVPSRGIRVPELGHRVCFAQTFFANGTQIPYSYLRLNGPVIRLGSFSGCRFDAAAFINDLAGGFAGVLPPPAPQAPFNNPDFYQITAEALTNTQLGTYTFKACASTIIDFHCVTLTLVIVQAPKLHQFVFPHKVSFSATGGVMSLKLGVSNLDSSSIFAQVFITATGSSGDTITASTSVFTIPAVTDVNNVPISLTLTKAMISETFTWSVFIAVGAVSTDPTTLTGTSTPFHSTQSATGTFVVTA